MIVKIKWSVPVSLWTDEHMKLQLSKTSHMVKRFQRELTNIKPTPECRCYYSFLFILRTFLSFFFFFFFSVWGSHIFVSVLEFSSLSLIGVSMHQFICLDCMCVCVCVCVRVRVCVCYFWLFYSISLHICLSVLYCHIERYVPKFLSHR